LASPASANFFSSRSSSTVITQARLASQSEGGDRYVTTFMKFLQTDAGRKAIDPEFLDRLTRANTKIDTLTALLKFARERWPDQFPADFRKDSGTAFGREAMRKIWRDYLTWSEGKPAKAA
jgi:hypothetical protein